MSEDENEWEPEVVFTAYFEGTANAVNRRMTQIGLFFELDRGVDVGLTEESAIAAARRSKQNDPPEPLRFKMAIDGCGFEHGLAGIVFAYGMQGQCFTLSRVIRALRAALQEPRTQLNIIGLSRGAVAALTVAAMLGEDPGLFVLGPKPPPPQEKSSPSAGDSSAGDDATPKLSFSTMAREVNEESNVVKESPSAWFPELFTSSSDALSGYIGSPQSKPKPTSKAQSNIPPPPPPPPPRRTSSLANILNSAGTFLSAKNNSQASKKVSSYKPTQTERLRAKSEARRSMRLNLILFDPVPGNQIITSRTLDPLRITTANGAKDVRSCEGILRRVLAIYPYEPLPAITFHAPLVPAYPDSPDCHVEEIVSLGCHQGAILCAPNRISCRLSYVMMKAFLLDHCHVKLRSCRPFDECLATTASKLRILETLRLAAIDDASKHGAQPHQIFISRHAHALIPYVAVIRNSTGRYLNLYHQRLIEEERKRTGEPSEDESVHDPRMPLHLLELRR